MKKLIHLLTLLLTFTTPSTAQIIGNETEVIVTLDREGWTYKCGEQANYKVTVLSSGTPLKNAVIDYNMGPEMYENIKKENVTLKDGTISLNATMNTPGFYRLQVTARHNGRQYNGSATAAFDPQNIKHNAQRPQDFDQFWDNAITEARNNVPLQATRRLIPEYSNEKVNVYEVSFQNIRHKSRTYGILCIPTKAGKYPALYKVPGAGCRPYYGDIYQAEKGCIVLEIGIHGVPVTNQKPFYEQLQNGPLCNYWTFNNNDKETFYYKRVIIEALRGIDYIATLPCWDEKNLGVLGSSQGGWLTIVCAALDKRVTCYAPVHPALCDLTASLKNIPCGWPHYFYNNTQTPDPKVLNTLAYYDGINFTQRITQPGWYSFGYNDDVVPPTTCWATYNNVKAPKEIHIYPKTKHYWNQEQYDQWIQWLDMQLNITHLK